MYWCKDCSRTDCRECLVKREGKNPDLAQFPSGQSLSRESINCKKFSNHGYRVPHSAIRLSERLSVLYGRILLVPRELTMFTTSSNIVSLGVSLVSVITVRAHRKRTNCHLFPSLEGVLYPRYSLKPTNAMNVVGIHIAKFTIVRLATPFH